MFQLVQRLSRVTEIRMDLKYSKKTVMKPPGKGFHHRVSMQDGGNDKLRVFLLLSCGFFYRKQFSISFLGLSRLNAAIFSNN
jgi:hypothetical protein